MKLADWLRQNGVSRVDFARRIGVSPAAVSQMCNNDAPWISRETAALVAEATGNAVINSAV